MKQCNRCLFTEDIAVIGEHQCNYCDIHDELERSSNPNDLEKQLSKIREQNGKYNCIMGISGGLDSSTLLYLAVVKWRLRPLVIHFDNNWNNEIARNNMDKLINKLSVDAITYRVNKEEYDLLNEAFLWAGTPDADIPNDIAMTKLMYDTADKYGIKYILNGHCFRTEGSTPAKWTYMDAKYIQDVYKKYTRLDLVNYPLFTFWDQIKYAIKGIKQVRPFHYITDRTKHEKDMIEVIGWESYGYKHTENIYTEFVGFELLPKKFGIDKRIVYLSAKIRSGNMTKEEALKELSEEYKFDYEKLGEVKEHTKFLMKGPVMSRSNYAKYNFKRYKPIIWLMSKMGVVPKTFYIKYAK